MQRRLRRAMVLGRCAGGLRVSIWISPPAFERGRVSPYTLFFRYAAVVLGKRFAQLLAWVRG
eukprot:1400295-Lingulodinium_polyedra.AAC.1